MSICTRILKFGNPCKITCYWCRYTLESGLPGDGQRSPRSCDSCCFASMKSLYRMLPDESRTTGISRNWPNPRLSRAFGFRNCLIIFKAMANVSAIACNVKF